MIRLSASELFAATAGRELTRKEMADSLDRINASLRKKPRKPRAIGTSGKTLETMILNSQRNDVILTQVKQSAKRIKGGNMVAVRGPCDFFGMHVATGRLIVIDAKETSHEHRLVTNDNQFPDHQRKQLLTYGRAGAIAGLIVLVRPTGIICWCDWKMLENPKPSIPIEEMMPMRHIDWRIIALPDCSGCTDPRSEGTHQMGTRQHP